MKVIDKSGLLDLTESSGGRYRVDNLEQAYQFCTTIATSHYENFPVGSFLIPEKVRKYFYSVYAFARIADDIADELSENNNIRIEALGRMNLMLEEKSFQSIKSGNPLLLALHDTMKSRNIPILPFQKLLIAFKRDINFVQADNYNDLLDYCSYSANPIGELVLRVFDLYNKQTAIYSDKICTALQLVNFWQDLSIDLKNERCYIPNEILSNHGLTKENLHDNKNSAKLSKCLSEIYDYTDNLFDEGEKLISLINDFRLKLEIKATLLGGKQILKRLKVIDSKVLDQRPALSKFDIIKVLIRAFVN